MYILKLKKDEFRKLLKENNKKQKQIAEITGVHKSYISQAVNGKPVSKLVAYSMCKSINSDLEIFDLFNVT